MRHLDDTQCRLGQRFDLQLFADDNGGNGGGGGGGGDQKPFASFASEAELTARLDQETKARQEALAKELGFDSVDAMKAAAKAKKEADDASKSELEREKAARAQAEAAAKAEREKANQYRIEADIKLAAMQAGFVDPADAVALVSRSTIQVDDKGAVTGVKEAVDALAKAKPHLVGAGAGKPPGTGGSAGNGGRQGGGGGDGGELGKRLAEQRKAAQGDIYFKRMS